MGRDGAAGYARVSGVGESNHWPVLREGASSGRARPESQGGRADDCHKKVPQPWQHLPLPHASCPHAPRATTPQTPRQPRPRAHPTAPRCHCCIPCCSSCALFHPHPHLSPFADSPAAPPLRRRVPLALLCWFPSANSVAVRLHFASRHARPRPLALTLLALVRMRSDSQNARSSTSSWFHSWVRYASTCICRGQVRTGTPYVQGQRAPVVCVAMQLTVGLLFPRGGGWWPKVQRNAVRRQSLLIPDQLCACPLPPSHHTAARGQAAARMARH